MSGTGVYSYMYQPTDGIGPAPRSKQRCDFVYIVFLKPKILMKLKLKLQIRNILIYYIDTLNLLIFIFHFSFPDIYIMCSVL